MNPDRKFIVMCLALSALIALAIMASLFLSGCVSVPRPPVSPIDAPAAGSGVGATLGTIGNWHLWLGALGVTAGILAGIFGGGIVRTLGLEVAIAGLATLVLGSAFMWLADRPWVLGLAVVASGIALAVWYWRRIGKAVASRRKDKTCAV